MLLFSGAFVGITLILQWKLQLSIGSLKEWIISATSATIRTGICELKHYSPACEWIKRKFGAMGFRRDSILFARHVLITLESGSDNCPMTWTATSMSLIVIPGLVTSLGSVQKFRMTWVLKIGSMLHRDENNSETDERRNPLCEKPYPKEKQEHMKHQSKLCITEKWSEWELLQHK